MQMSFWWSSKYPHFLFYRFNINSEVEFVFTCLLLFVLAVAIEGLKVLQAKQRQRDLFLRSKQLQTICPAQDLSLLSNGRSPTVTRRQRLFLFVWELFAWINLQILSLLLMLSVMGFNGWMFLSIAAGSGLGYFLFGIQLMKINLQNCDIVRGTFCVLAPPNGESTPILQATPTVSSTSIRETSHYCHENILDA